MKVCKAQLATSNETNWLSWYSNGEEEETIQEEIGEEIMDEVVNRL